jgi:hypothetical protein
MVLSTSNNHADYLGHARRAVRLLNEDVCEMVDDAASAAVQLAETLHLLLLGAPTTSAMPAAP